MQELFTCTLVNSGISSGSMSETMVQIQVRLPKDLAVQVKKLAKAQIRSVSAQIALLVRDGLKENK